MRKLTVFALAGALIAALAAPAAARPSQAEAAKPSSQSIVDIVLADDGEFDILQAAVIEAGLVAALDGRRQLTVFAPTDAAFVSTFEGLLDADLNEGAVIDFIEAGQVDAAFGEGALANILLYHVIPGRRVSTSVLAAPGYRTLSGDYLTKGELVDAGVVPADISARNGVIHVLSTGVLLP